MVFQISVITVLTMQIQIKKMQTVITEEMFVITVHL